MKAKSRVSGKVKIIKDQMDLFTEWEIKERLLSSARSHAEATGMQILHENHNGFEFILPDEVRYVSMLEFRHRLESEFPYIVSGVGAVCPQACGLEFYIQE